MKLHEYQARELLRDYGIAVPDGQVAQTADAAAEAAAKWDGAVVVKGQVLTGGRGKAGAIKVVSSVNEARAAADKIIGMTVKDLPVNQVLITERINIAAEYYLGITIDREAESVVLILSAAGGMDIEEVAATEPDKIRRLTLTADPSPESLKTWLADSFPDPGHLEQAVPIIVAMNKLFREKDCSLVEINPLAITAEGKLVAADAKVVLDDNAVPFHPELAELRNDEEYTADEIEANAAGLSFVSLEGEIGCMVNGAGLAMATMDGIKLAGGTAANFLDVGGSSNPEKVLTAMRILLRNEQLKVILINIFGGITRCDDVARGILMARDQLGITVPMVIRLVGTNETEGRDLLQKAGLIAARSMTEAIEQAVAQAQGATAS
ncbi:MAG: ADP-forming succinate--CoA ligase subunit beta [Phycisphaeraceae bacterium]|nr:ADP-forming succinate--CoA ligase subunit beta [Phycisphaeraceae bacterium]